MFYAGPTCNAGQDTAPANRQMGGGSLERGGTCAYLGEFSRPGRAGCTLRHAPDMDGALLRLCGHCNGRGGGGAAPTFHRILGSGQLGAAAFKLAVSRLRPVSLLKRSTPRYRQLFLPSHWVPHKARFDGAFVGSHAPLFPHVVFLAHAAGGLS